jgi:hypothetical protein
LREETPRAAHAAWRVSETRGDLTPLAAPLTMRHLAMRFPLRCRSGLAIGSGVDVRAFRGLLGALCLAWPCGATALAQPAPEPSDTDLAKQSENPVTRLYTLPLRYEGDLGYGPYDATKSIIELDQAVVPFSLNEDWALITRTKLPFYAQPPKKTEEQWSDGLGNGYTTLFISPEHSTGFVWGAGPVIYFPTATNSAVGVNKWGAGPSIAFGWLGRAPWTAAVVANNIWSVGGPPRGNDKTNSLLLNPIVSYHLGNGWFLDSSPNITSDWGSAPDKRWTVPVGGGAGKVFHVGAQPVKFAVDAYYDPIRPAGTGPLWEVTATLTFLFAR